MTTAAPPVNYWPQTATAKAFWGQQELPAYRQLLRDTVAWLEPKVGERWLDLGCGGGQLSKALWTAAGGKLREVVGLDCAAANAREYAKHRDRLQPPPGERLRFIAASFSDGLPYDLGDHFDGVVSGLAIQYAESYSEVEGRWTTEAYDRLLDDVYRVLKPGGRFVFSVNVPEPSWLTVGLHSVLGAFVARHPLRYLQKAWAMLHYGGWLKREARTGRFHFLPAETVHEKLEVAGFTKVEWRLSYARQAYVFRGWKPDMS